MLQDMENLNLLENARIFSKVFALFCIPTSRNYHFSRSLSMLGFSDSYKTFSNLILSVALIRTSLVINVAECLYADVFIGHLYFLTSSGRVELGRFPQPGWL